MGSIVNETNDKTVYVFEIYDHMESRQGYFSPSDLMGSSIRLHDIESLLAGGSFHDDYPGILFRGDTALICVGPVRGILSTTVSHKKY